MEQIKNDLSTKELVELFMHFDKINMAKENLFIPLSIAIFPAVIASWKSISVYGVIMAAIISISIYGYHILVCKRFKEIQDKVLKLIFKNQGGTENSQIYKIVNPRCLRISIIRTLFFLLIILFWILLVIVRSCN
jgi:hypothetical protein